MGGGFIFWKLFAQFQNCTSRVGHTGQKLLSDVWDHALIMNKKPDILPKLAHPQAGSDLIDKAHDNGNATIVMKTMTVTGRVIRGQLQPYYKAPE